MKQHYLRGFCKFFVFMVMIIGAVFGTAENCLALRLEMKPIGYRDPVVLAPCWPRVVRYEIKALDEGCRLALNTGGLDFSFSQTTIGRDGTSILTINFPCWDSQTKTASYRLQVCGTNQSNRTVCVETMLYIGNIQVTLPPAEIHVRRMTYFKIPVTVSPLPAHYPPLQGSTELIYQMRGENCDGTNYLDYQCSFDPKILPDAVGTSELTVLAPQALGRRCIRVWAKYLPNDYINSEYSSKNHYIVVSDIPDASTGNPNSVGATFAEFTTGVVPNCSTSFGWVEYGETTQYGNSTTKQEVYAFSQYGESLDWRLTNLKPNTQYHYRAVAENEWNIKAYGADRTFTTGAVTDAQISVDRTSIDFGSVESGGTSTIHTVAVSNVGTTDLVINAIAVTGGDETAFTVQTGTCASMTPTIAPGASCTLSAAFAPQGEATFASTLRILSNSNGTPQLDIPLTGTGIPAPPPNLATGKEIMQSSYDFGRNGREAVDGDTGGDFGAGDVSCTGYEAQPWWMVDLGDIYNIDRIDVFNRRDCCAERLSDFDVKVSPDGVNWHSHHITEICQNPTTVEYENVTARYVKIQLRGVNFLSISEVRIQGEGPIYDNLAVGKGVTQSSDDFGKNGSEAVDGNTSGVWTDNSISCTAYTAQPWWKVDLEDIFEIHQVNIYNRTDCCWERLSNFNVEVSADDVNWTTIHVPGEAQRPTTVDFGGVEARYVRVQLLGSNWLSLAEVEVMGKGPVLENIALGKTADQSSDNFGTDGSEAVDGNRDGDSAAGSTSHTHPDAPSWWEVNLGAVYPIEEVRVFNRTDCCAQRLRNFEVQISTDRNNWETIPVPDQALRPSYIDFGGHNGQYVRIRLTGVDFLSLPEVEVMIKK